MDVKTDINAGVYCIINKINDKKYVGSSIDIEKRWQQHKSDLGRRCHANYHLQKAWDKYGEENFEFRVLVYTDPDEAVALEDNLLKNYPDLFEYNISRDATAPMLGRVHLEESKQKISKALSGENNPNFGKHRSKETKRKLSEALSGENNPNFGKHPTEATRAKMSKAQSGENHPLFGKHHREETRAKMSKALLGENNPFFGKAHSEETRAKMKESHLGDKNYNWKNIPEEKINEMKSLREQGYSYRKIAEIFGVSINIVWRRLNTISSVES